MRTFDQTGNLIGDTAAAPAAAPPVAMPQFNWAVLLEPPLVYFVAIGIGLAAYLYERSQRQ